MKRKASRSVVVHAVRSLSPGDKLLIKYNLYRPPNSHQMWLSLGLPLDFPMWCKKKIIL